MKKNRSIKDIIYKELLDKRFLKENKLSYEYMLNLLESGEFARLIISLELCRNVDNRFDSLKVEKTCKGLTEFFSDGPEEGFCEFIYRYIRHSIFSHIKGPMSEEKYYVKAMIFLQILRALYIYEKETMDFDPTYQFKLLGDKEAKKLGCIKEYKHLKNLARQKYIFEFMRIGRDITPFNTVGHIGGVHYISMLVANQLKRSGVPVDIGLVSGAALGHDIGKYGCRKEEERRVPYLHYYYTNLCLTSNNMPVISHIASNHSTWDLELENLSVESLILIYSDFRVKSSRNKETGSEDVHFYSLKESFQVILDKLDNVDEAKKHRYVRVYNKLKDFEDYMIEHGVHTEVPKDFSMYEDVEILPIHRDYSLLYKDMVCKEFKYQAIDHNIKMMRGFYVDRKFGTIIEAARTERKWKNLRTYIDIFGEYSKYMLESQKIMTISFLYEMLMNKDGDIRKRAAETLGNVISNFTEEFRKEIPEGISFDRTTKSVNLFKKYLKKIMKPDYRHTEQHKIWIKNCLGDFINSAIRCSTESIREEYFKILNKLYQKRHFKDDEILILIQTVMNMDRTFCPDYFYKTIQTFLSDMEKKGDEGVKIASIYVAKNFVENYKEEWYYKSISYILGITDSKEDFQESLSLMFLDDLKGNTPWTVKVANISLMLYFARKGLDKAYLLHIATHLVNLIKVSESITVRAKAGETLLEITELLPVGQKNEIALELLNGLESGDYQFVKYIPIYLGQILVNLPPEELDDFLGRIKKALPECEIKTAGALINTVGIMISNYENYGEKFGEKEDVSRKRLNSLMNILIKQAAGFREVIYQEAFTVLGKTVFQSEKLSSKLKGELFAEHSKKILTIMEGCKENEIDFYTFAAALNSIYRFIGFYQWDIGEFPYKEIEKVAFFPGTFDPFSLGHKAIATTIRDLGIEVFLALDGFSWSKKTQPRLERRKIVEMSVGDENDIYLFPDDISINIANPKDIRKLKETFEGKEVYMVVGSDVVKNASCYKGEVLEDSIHTLNHIIFIRESSKEKKKNIAEEVKRIGNIKKNILQLTLPKYCENISSTLIRENIDSGRDIQNLIDPMAQNYIYSRNLYLREPEYKHVLVARGLHISEHEAFPEDRIDELKESLYKRGYNIDRVKAYLKHKSVETVYFQRELEGLEMRAFAASKKLSREHLIDEFRNLDLANKIRKVSGGKIAVIGMLFSKETKIVSNPIQYILTELLTELIQKEYTYAIYNPVEMSKDEHKIIEVLRRQGFVNIAESEEKPVYAVDLREPIIIFKDIEETIKEPFNKNPKVIRTIEKCHNRMLEAFNSIYPGKLIISFSTSALYNKIIEKVADLNKVSLVPDPNKRRGPYMSVPFGGALTSVVVPNTVTKALHSEKYFNEDMTGFRIGEQKYYSSLDDQVKTIKSFDRPVILIDDLLHKGYRLNQLRPILNANNVKIKSLVVGVLTGRAKDEMKLEGVEVKSAYNIPRIEFWLNEKESYPCIGGNSIDLDYMGDHFINMIMPFSFPQFIDSGNYESIYKYSIVSLKNTLDLLHVLEREYQNHFEKKLTLRRLGEVLESPKVPDLGMGISYDENISASTFVRNYIGRQIRLGNPLEKDFAVNLLKGKIDK